MHVYLTTHLKRRLSLQKESFCKLLFIPLLTLLLGISIPTTSIHAQAGTTWTSRTASVTGVWNCVAYGNGIFVALGTNTSTMMTSPDGITWTTRTAAAGNFWRSVTYGNGLFVAVSANGTISNQIMTSTDGINWTSRTAPTANMGWNSVTYGNGLFVAVAGTLGTGTGAKVMTSTDGINWTSRTASANTDWTSVTYGNGQFVAVASGSTTSTVMTSPDGITWTGRTASVVCNWSSVAYGNNMYVAVANGSKTFAGISRLMSSPDAITWTTRGTNNFQVWNSVIYANNLFVAVAASGTNRVFTSPDGITWTGRTAAAANSWQSVAYGNGVFVAVSDDGTSQVMTSGCAATTPSVSIAASTLTPCYGASVTFTATPTNGGTTPTYQWKKNSNTIANATSATYTGTAGTDFASNDLISCVLTSSDACASPTTATSADITMSVTSNVTPSVNIVANPSSAITPNTSVTFTATPTNGGATPAYQWKKNNSNIGTNSNTYTDATLVAGDIISCEMTSNANCVSPSTITSNEIVMIVSSGCSAPTAYTVTGTGAYCAGGTGLEVGLTNSTIGVNYQLMNGANTVGSPINGTGTNISFGNQTTAATYTVIATTATGGCTATMTGNAVITINSATADAGADVIITCSNPSTTLSASGGANYAWNNGATQDGTVSPTVTTTYTVTVTDANGCTAMDDVVVTVDKTAPSSNAGLDVVINCSNPSTVLTASGGTSYTWNNGATQGGTVSPNITTTYTVTVTGANGCTATDDVVVTVDKTAPSANAGADVVVNCSNPSTVLTASGGTSYTWNNSASQGGTVSPNVTTTYTVTVTAANGCTATDDVVVTVDKTAPSANAGADVVVNCSSTSTVLTASGGSSYTWNNGASQGGTVSPNVTTTYTVTVTGSNGCTATDDVVVTVDKTAPSANAGADVAITCANLSTVLTASGGVSYVWDNGITQGETVSPNVTTTYTVTVTAANGCTATDDVVVTVDKTAPSANAGVDVVVNCTNPGTVLTASGGTSYTWNNGASQGGTVSPNVTTTYTVTVTAANGCTATDDVVVTVDKTAPSANAGSDVVVNCSNPSTVLTASGGTSYTWNNGASQDATVSPTVTTTYTVIVTAANGCTATDDVVVTVDKTAPLANAGSDVVVNCSNPSTVLTASGGGSYIWNNGASQGGTVSPNTTTTYTVTVTAANGCTATDDVVVTVDKTAPSANAGSDVVVNCSSPSTVLTASGGTSYTWNNGASQDATVSPTVTTTYTVIVTAANGCTATDDVVVMVDKTAPSADAGSDVVVNCTNPGTVLTASGGTSYTWNNGASQDATVSPNTTTTYTVTVTAANGCTATDVVVVTVDKTAPSANAGSDVVVNCSNPSTVLTASGGTSYTWNNGASQGGTVSPNVTTTYTVTVTAVNGCTATDDVIITSNKTFPTANAGSDITITCSNPSTVLIASGGNSYTWNNGASQGATVSPNTTTTYTVTVTDASGCTATDDVVVTVDKTTPLANAGTDVIITCSNPSTTLSATGGISYIWDNRITQGDIVSPDVTTTYTVTVTAANGCTATDDIVISIDKTTPTADAGTDAVVTCSNPSTVLTASGGVNYAWNNGTAQGGSVSPTVTTTYTVTVTAANGCTATDNIVVTANKVYPNSNNVTGGGSYCAGETTGIAVGLSNSQIGVNYQLINGTTNVGSVVAGTGAAISFGNQLAGSYTVVATTTKGGCVATMAGSAEITINPLPTIYNITGNGTYCAGETTGIAIGLSNSQIGVNYQLINGITNVGSVVAGTDAAISFGNQLAAGTYTVVATNASTSCSINMIGTSSIVIDETLPAFDLGSVPQNVTINCTDAIPVVSNPVATNACSTVAMTTSSTKSTNTAQCSFYSYVITHTWTATDKRGNTATISQTITVQDKAAPVIAPLSNITVTEGTIPTTVASMDNCMTTPVITYTETKVTNTPSPCKNYSYILTRTWIATDACGNSSTAMQTIKAEGISLTCPTDKTIYTNSDGINNYNCSTLATAAMGVAPAFTDGCDAGVLRYTITGATTGTGNGSVAGITFLRGVSTVTYSLLSNVSDQCTLNITVLDNEGPRFTMSPTVVIDACSFPNPIPSTHAPTLSDNCSGVSTLEVVADVTADQTGCNTKPSAQKYTKLLTRTWKATDINGNSATTVQRIYLRDNTPPITVVKNITVYVPSSFKSEKVHPSAFNNGSNDNCTSMGSLVYSGTCGTTVSGTNCKSSSSGFTFSAPITTASPMATFAVSIKTTDACGNISNTVSANVTFKKTGTLSNNNNGANSSIDTQESSETNTASTEASTIPTVQGEMKCYPTPFSEDLNVQYNLTEDVEMVTLKVYDNQGRLVKTLEQEAQLIGFYQVRWNLSDLTSGMYHVCLELNGKCTKMERVIMMK